MTIPLPTISELQELLPFLSVEELAEMDSLLADVPTTEPTRNPIALTAYKHQIHKRYHHAPHLAALDALLTSVTRYVETQGREGIGRAIIEMPPRHGKTLSTSRLYPTWHIGRNPDHRAILVSYGADLAEKNSRAARNLIASPVYQGIFDNVRLALDSKSASAWDIAGREGGLDAMGIGGGVTGKGAHILIIDDPIKNREQAESETWREKVWDSYTDDLYTRLEPGGAVVVMMTRWHQDDLIGRLLLREPEKWHRLTLPAFAKENDPIGRETGAALWSTRYPLSVLEDIKSTLGAYSWSALYDQNPIPSEGGLFKRANFKLIDSAPRNLKKQKRFWDLALSEKTSADYTVGVLMGETTDGDTVVLDVRRFQVEWDDVVGRIAAVAVQDGEKVDVGVETAFFQTRAVQKLLKRPELHNHNIKGYKPDTDKFTRALPFAARVGAGMVFVVRGAWMEDYLAELCAFPLGANDDQVDASSGAYLMLDSRPPLTVETRRYA